MVSQRKVKYLKDKKEGFVIPDEKSFIEWSDTAIFITHVKDMLKYTVSEYCSDGSSHGYLIRSNNTGNNDQRKLLYLLHGGPNGSYAQNYSTLNLLLLTFGFDILVCNYPGSTGYGLNYLEALSGNIGDLDVTSTGNFITHFLQANSDKYNTKEVYVYGGSHGGFLSSWLSVDTRFNSLFKGSLIHNPVIDIYSLYTTSDIKDWSYELPTGKYLSYAPSNEDMIEMKKKSPISFVHQAKPKILLFVSGEDKRVTSLNQGVQFYHHLRSFKKDVKMKFFPQDDHPIAGLESSVEYIFTFFDFLQDEK